MNTFYNSNLSSIRFSKVEENLKFAREMSTSIAFTLNNLNHELKIIGDSIITLNQIMAGSLNPTYSQAIVLFIDSLMGHYTQYLQHAQSIRGCFDNNKLLNLQSVQSDNNTLPQTQIFELNEKIVNDIIISTIAIGTSDFTEYDKITLFNIASQCPLIGGPAVDLARSLYAIIKDTIFTDDCIYETDLLTKSSSKENSVSFSLMPNPTRDLLTITWDNLSEDFGHIEIFNSSGIQVLKRTINQKKWF